MLRRNCSSRKRLKRAKTEKQRKNKTNVCSLRKKVKETFLVENADL